MKTRDVECLRIEKLKAFAIKEDLRMAKNSILVFILTGRNK